MNSYSNNQYQQVVGVDIGATKLAVGVVSTSGIIHHRLEVPTIIDNGGEAVLNQCICLIFKAIELARPVQPIAIGIGTIGTVKNDIIVRSRTITDWQNIDLRTELRKRLSIDIPVFVSNDIHVAALGEYYFGCFNSPSKVAYISVGTGIGCAMVRDGKVDKGEHNMAGQIAHIPLLDSTIQGICSGGGISRRASEAIGIPLSTADVFLKAREGNTTACKIINDAIDGMAWMLSFIQQLSDPNTFILGGGVALGQSDYINQVRDRMQKILSPYHIHLSEGIDINPATLGCNSGIVGAAMLASISLDV